MYSSTVTRTDFSAHMQYGNDQSLKGRIRQSLQENHKISMLIVIVIIFFSFISFALFRSFLSSHQLPCKTLNVHNVLCSSRLERWRYPKRCRWLQYLPSGIVSTLYVITIIMFTVTIYSGQTELREFGELKFSLPPYLCYLLWPSSTLRLRQVLFVINLF